MLSSDLWTHLPPHLLSLLQCELDLLAQDVSRRELVGLDEFVEAYQRMAAGSDAQSER